MRIKIDEYYDSDGCERKSIITAQLLIMDEKFLSAVEKVCLEISLKEYINVPKKPTVQRLIKLLDKLEEKNKKLLKKSSKKIVLKFELPSDWIYSIEILILTNVFFIPPTYSSIKLHIPPQWLGVGTEREEGSKAKNNKAEDLLPWKEVENYPAIYFKGRVSIKQIKDWLNKNGGELKKYTNRLDKVNNTKIQDKTIFWRDIIFRIQEAYPNESWSKIVKRIQNFVSSYFDSDGSFLTEVDDEMKTWLREAYEESFGSEEYINFRS